MKAAGPAAAPPSVAAAPLQVAGGLLVVATVVWLGLRKH